MSRLRRCVKLCLPLLLVAAIPILFIACTPAWLPDSKGFVYVDQIGRVMHFDLAKGEPKQIVVGGVPFAAPAMWHDGSRFVLVIAPKGGEDGPRLGFYDLAGERLDLSPPMDPEGGEGGGRGGGADPKMIHLYCSVDGNHVVMFHGEGRMAAVYDVKARKFRYIPSVLAPVHIGGNPIALFDVSPITPDGLGFLAIDISEHRESFTITFHPWDADKPPVKIKHEFDLDEFQKLAGDKEWGVSTLPRWEKDGNLRGRLQGGVLELNLMKKTLAFREDMTSEALLQYAEREKVRVVYELPDDALIQFKGQEMQLAKRRGGEPVLLHNWKGEEMVGTYPSPDGKKLLLHNFMKGKLTVYNTAGEVIAEHQGPKME